MPCDFTCAYGVLITFRHYAFCNSMASHVFFADKSSDDRVCVSFDGLHVVLSRFWLVNPLQDLNNVCGPL